MNWPSFICGIVATYGLSLAALVFFVMWERSA